MRVKEVMHKGVEWVGPDTRVIELAKLMRRHDIGAIPIGENDRLVGMVTDRDIVCKGLADDSFDARRGHGARCDDSRYPSRLLPTPGSSEAGGDETAH
jgi:predicted transcriptional regulator